MRLPFYDEVFGRSTEAQPFERPDICESESGSDSEESTTGGIFKSTRKQSSKRSSTMAKGSRKSHSRKAPQQATPSDEKYRIQPNTDPRRSTKLPIPNQFGIFSRGRLSVTPPSIAQGDMVGVRQSSMASEVDGDGPIDRRAGAAAGHDFLAGLEEAASVNEESTSREEGKKETHDENNYGKSEDVDGPSGEEPVVVQPKTPTRKPGRPRKDAKAQAVIDTPRRTRGNLERERLQEEKERLERRPRTRSSGITKTGLNGRRQETARSVTLKKTPKHKANTCAKRGQQNRQQKLVDWRGRAMKLVQGQAYVVV